jgi:hypothetical protein
MSDLRKMLYLHFYIVARVPSAIQFFGWRQSSNELYVKCIMQRL